MIQMHSLVSHWLTFELIFSHMVLLKSKVRLTYQWDIERQWMKWRHQLLFAAVIKIQIGDGRKTSFWNDAWPNGCWPKDLAPLAYKASNGKKRTLRDAITDDTWISDIRLQDVNTAAHIYQVVSLWVVAQDIVLSEGTEDQISWSLTQDEEYTSSSAYKA